MATQDLERIEQILKSGDFSQFIGMEEDSLLEVKSAPYDLATPEGRYELAKDVSAFANAGAGYLIIGLATKRPQNALVDVVDSLTLIPEAAFPVPKYAGVIREYSHPEIKGLAIDWMKANGEADRRHLG